jgi:Cof subfamily protein (haloacid dehalogenase superfamily)
MSGSRAIRLLLADVDGTLVTTEKVLTETAKSAVRDLHKSGIAFAITSGRPPRGMAMLVAPLALRTPIAAFNGGIFVKPDLSVIEAHLLPPKVSARTIQFLIEQGTDVWVYTENEWLVRESRAPHVARETKTVQFGPKVVSSFTADHLLHAAKIVGVSDNPKLITDSERTLADDLGRDASVAHSQPYYLDITPSQANKGNVVKTLSRLLGIPAADIATIGDMPNDIPMFNASGYSIAMGQASADVKVKADAVTESNENDGFAKAVRRYVLAEARVQ